MTQTMATSHAALGAFLLGRTGMISSIRSPLKVFSNYFARLGECIMIFLAHTTCILVLYMTTQALARLNQLLARSYLAGVVGYRRFGRPLHCLDTFWHV